MDVLPSGAAESVIGAPHLESMEIIVTGELALTHQRFWFGRWGLRN